MSKQPKDDRVYLRHITECLARIALYTESGREEFFTDMKTQDAVLRNLQTMAESTQQLSEVVEGSTRNWIDVPWALSAM